MTSPGPDLLHGDLDAGPHQTEAGVEDLQQGPGLEDLEGGGGGGVQVRHGAAPDQVSHHLVEEEAPAQELDRVVGDQVEFCQHDGAAPGVRSALAK